jgi:nucleoside-diphosphate-sugar epimerase
MSDADDGATEGSTTGAGLVEALDDELLESDTLVTGFPGFLATRLLREMLAYEHEGDFVFLVESRFRDEAKQRLQNIERDVPNFEGSWDVVVGDITDEFLGLDDEVYEELTDRIECVWHLAAVYDLAVAEAVAYRVNVQGTIHVLDFCEACDDFRRLNYVSSCYVSGEREGTVYEEELDEGQSHKNHYESTKFWAEVEIQRRRDTIPTAIFRPGIVVGDSQTGETDKYDGPYYLFKLLQRLPNWMPIPNIGDGDRVVNIVPVDFATQAMAYIGMLEGAEGDVYQIADPHPMKARDIFTLALDCMGRAPPVGSVPASLPDFALRNESVEEFVGVPREMLIYFNHGARYDTSNTQRALEGTSIHCPHLSTYMQTLIDYFLRHPDRPEAGLKTGA